MALRRLRRLAGALAAVVAGSALATSAAHAQQAATLTGRVTSDRGGPIQYATVSIAAIGVGGQTDANGRYSILIPSARLTGRAAQVEARAIGHKPGFVTVTLNPGRIDANFTLATNPLNLGEVIVTGSGTTQVREKLGTAVSTVRAEDIKKAAEVNVVNALAAKAPGVEVTSQAGDPGAGTGIVIRGFNTIQGNGQPLFVVDGMPIDNSVTVTDGSDVGFAYSNRALDINPADIENIEILKGAAAAALYGVRGSNGVVLITTKSGRAGATRYTFSSIATMDQVNRPIPLQREFGRGVNGVTPTCADDDFCQLRSWGARLPAGTQTFDQFGALFRTGSQFDNNLQISGGDANRTFLLSVGYLDQTGVARGPNSNMQRATARLRATQQLGSKLKLGGNIAYTDIGLAAIQKGNNLNGLLLGATRQPPEFNPLPWKTDAGLQRAWSLPNPQTAGNIPIFDGPFWVLNEHRNTSSVGRTIGNVTVDYEPFSWATVNYTLGVDYGNEKRLSGLPPNSAGDAETGQVWESAILNTQVDHNLLVTLRRDFSRNVQTRLIGGQNLNVSRFRLQQAKGVGYIVPDLFSLNNVVSANITPQNAESQVNIAGYFVQSEWDLWNQLYLQAGVRADQASTLPRDNRTAFFPKASAVWNITNFLGNTANTGRLSYLKARASWGQVGRQPFAYQNQTLLSAGQSAFAYGTGATNTSQSGTPGLVTSFTEGNPDLKFERTTDWEAGFDAAFLNSRVDVAVTYYDRNTRDVILPTPVAPSTGFGQSNGNLARITNKGWEISLNSRIIDMPGTRWELGLNWTRNRNKVITLGGAEFQYLTGGFGVSAAVPGQPIGVFYGSDFVRCRLGVPDANNVQTINGVDVDINAACRTAGARDGAMYIAADGFPRLDAANYVVGDPNRNYLLGIRNTVTLFKKLQVSALLDIVNGGVNWNGTRGALQSYGTSGFTADRGAQKTFGVDFIPGATFGPGSGRAVAIGEGWYRSPAATVDPGPGLGNNFNGPVAQFVEPSGFARLRDVSVAYSFDGAFVRDRLGFSSVDVRLSGRNLWLRTKYSGIDPETNLSGPIGPGRGQDYFNNPQTRSFVLGVTINR